MTILVRRVGERWQRVEPEEFVDEAQLQTLLYESPELISQDERPIVFLREAALPGSGYTDLLGVDARGDIVLLETKLARNPEIRRKVIGQILEYAAFLWGTSYSDFNEMYRVREGSSLLDLMRARTPDLGIEAFERAVAENLAAGRFRLVIVVDDMNDELEKIIAYLSSRGGGLKVEAAAMRIYREGETQVLVPQLYGQLSQPEATVSAPAPRQSVEGILEACRDEHTRALLELVINEWEAAGHEVAPRTKGVSCRAEICGQPQPIFWADPRWGLSPLFDESVKRGAPEEAVKVYRRACGAIPGFDADRCEESSRPCFSFSGLREPDVNEFLTRAKEFVGVWGGMRRAATAE